MANFDFIPLGFSDLSSDEAFVVSGFRLWQSSGTSCHEPEISLTDTLKNDRLREGLCFLFDFFGTLPDWHRRKASGNSSVLTAIEETLLNEIGSVDGATKQSVKSFKQILDQAGIIIRPASEIPRSGYDHLLEVIGRKTARVFDALYPEFWETLRYQG